MSKERRSDSEHRSDAEKVVKALRAACIEVPRGEDWHQPEGASDALADFVVHAQRCRDSAENHDLGAPMCVDDYDAALTRLREVLS